MKKKVGISKAASKAFDIVKAFLNRGMFWEIHPLFRPASTIEFLGSLNGVLGNLILASFTVEQITEAKNSRMLFAMPIMDARHNTYSNWTNNTFDFAISRVFPDVNTDIS